MFSISDSLSQRKTLLCYVKHNVTFTGYDAVPPQKYKMYKNRMIARN